MTYSKEYGNVYNFLGYVSGKTISFEDYLHTQNFIDETKPLQHRIGGIEFR